MMEYLNFVLVIGLVSLPSLLGHQRSPPGVPPQQYAPGTGQPQYQQQHIHQQQQQQQYQRTAPGVPPSQYQEQQQYQPPPPSHPQQQQYQAPPQQQQQYQAPPQQQQQYQAPPQQQQQYQAPPQQQQQYQAPPQQQQQQYQAPPQQQHQQPQHGDGHGHPQQQRVLHSDNIKEEREHIKDHLEVPLDTSGMSDEELQYHYFKMHDADNNNRLDGQELIKSLFHWHDSANHQEATKTGHAMPQPKIFSDEELINMIDPIMDQDDGNRDGYIDYPEFVTAQQKAAAGAPAGPPST